MTICCCGTMAVTAGPSFDEALSGCTCLRSKCSVMMMYVAPPRTAFRNSSLEVTLLVSSCPVASVVSARAATQAVMQHAFAVHPRRPNFPMLHARPRQGRHWNPLYALVRACMVLCRLTGVIAQVAVCHIPIRSCDIRYGLGGHRL